MGLPLARCFADAGMSVVLLDIDAARVAAINRGESYVEDVPDEVLGPLVGEGGSLRAPTTTHSERPTPCGRASDPSVAEPRARPFDRSGSSPEDRRAAPSGPPRGAGVDDLPRHDARGRSTDPRDEWARGGEGLLPCLLARAHRPGREDWTVKTTPKVVGGITARLHRARLRASTGARIDNVFSVSSPRRQSSTKLLENIFRSVNIALVNELAQLCDRMQRGRLGGVEAAATKPFGFMSFKPGPGLGGHCLPVDPFYLAWKAREFDFYTEFIELAGRSTRTCRTSAWRRSPGRSTPRRRR